MLRNQRGLTLFEIIVAIGITSLFFVMVGTLSVTVQTNYQKTKENNERSTEIRRMITLIDDTIASYNQLGLSLSVDDDRLIKGTEDVLFFDTEDPFLHYFEADADAIRRYPAKHLKNVTFETDGDLLIVSLTDDYFTHRIAYTIIGGIT